MILRKIEIVNRSVDTEFSYSLRKKSKHITNYISRTCLQKLKFRSDTFDIIVISLDEAGREVCIINKGLVIPVLFDKIAYNNLDTENAIRVFHKSNIICGLKKVRNQYDIPENAIIESLSKLETNGFRNEWLFKKKVDRRRKIEVELNCKLSIYKFELVLQIAIVGKVICEQIVLETDPDEVAFYHLFKDIMIDDDTISVPARISGNLLEYSIGTGNLKINKLIMD